MRIEKLIILSVCLGLVVVLLGAYTRLTNAGLGCPDWPGCYGHMVLPQKKTSLTRAQLNFPEQPIEQAKAWTEMVHRYMAGTLGAFICLIAFIAIRSKLLCVSFPFFMPLLLVALVVFQAMLGMWTVTLQLLPVVVMGHLLGGMSIVACLWGIYLSSQNPRYLFYQDKQFKHWALLGLALVILQIALGGWVSANYAGIACVGFPSCNGQWLPSLNVHDAYNFFAPAGTNFQGGVLNSEARQTIQFFHRLGAMIVFSYIIVLAFSLLIKAGPALKSVASAMLFFVIMQFALGVINVIDLLPLPIAVAHNGVALLLLLSMVTLNHHLWRKEVNHVR